MIDDNDARATRITLQRVRKREFAAISAISDFRERAPEEPKLRRNRFGRNYQEYALLTR